MTRVGIPSVRAREVFDGRGVPAIEVDVRPGAGLGRSAAPFGASGSRGEFEASAYGALDVTRAVQTVETEVARRLVDARGLVACDAVLRDLDGTPNFPRIGGNTAMTIAVATAAAEALDVPLHAAATRTVGSGPIYALSGHALL